MVQNTWSTKSFWNIREPLYCYFGNFDLFDIVDDTGNDAIDDKDELSGLNYLICFSFIVEPGLLTAGDDTFDAGLCATVLDLFF